MSLLKTGACFTNALEANCPTIVNCITALPVGPAGVAGTTQVLGKDGQYHALPAAAAPITFATPAETITGTSTTLAVNPADLYTRENISAQTGLGLVLSAIPAPTASQSNWGVNTLGETLHYMPNIGWKIVSDKYHQTVATPITAAASGTWLTGIPVVAPRTGLVIISGFGSVASTSTVGTAATSIFINGSQQTQANMDTAGSSGTAANVANIGYIGTTDTPAITRYVTQGDVIAIAGIMVGSSFTLQGFTQITYIN